ncbi:hypothetical protein ZIOFF_063405 [Zingiber officinale]|uniref:Uncharacterized protein n=1 Tax=Zingiber officinale TaxID=94328 RepID=A0A8J5FB61_ZINOF|nr:hypothetical protein ZIOFF_063405 [Zingiber officinale]
MTPATLLDRTPSEGETRQRRPPQRDSRASGAVKSSRTDERAPDAGHELGDVRAATVAEEAAAAESGRERLKRHRTEMGGRVWIPEIWGQESLLKDWTDGSVFDRPLVPKGLTLPAGAGFLTSESEQSKRPSRLKDRQAEQEIGWADQKGE